MPPWGGVNRRDNTFVVTGLRLIASWMHARPEVASREIFVEGSGMSWVLTAGAIQVQRRTARRGVRRSATWPLRPDVR